jgi:hypothetical protein
VALIGLLTFSDAAVYRPSLKLPRVQHRWLSDPFHDRSPSMSVFDNPSLIFEKAPETRGDGSADGIRHSKLFKHAGEPQNNVSQRW